VELVKLLASHSPYREEESLFGPCQHSIFF